MWQTERLIGTIERQLALAVVAEESFGPEPTLAELVRDPITHSLMLADHVEHDELDALLQRARAQLFVSRLI